MTHDAAFLSFCKIKYCVDTWFVNQTAADGVVTIVCWIEMREMAKCYRQPFTSCLTNHSELYNMSRLLNNKSRRISIYTLHWRPSFEFEFSVSSALLTKRWPCEVRCHRPIVQKLSSWVLIHSHSETNTHRVHCSSPGLLGPLLVGKKRLVQIVWLACVNIITPVFNTKWCHLAILSNPLYRCRLLETRNVGQCPTWWPHCRI